MAKIYSPKVVADPIYGIIDIRPVLPMVETKEFQILGDKRQLGLSYLTFPSATHTRKAHSLGAYYSTRELANRWIKLGLINEKEGDALSGYALYHDIGHPPFSHTTEPLCLKDNDGLSFEIIKKLRKEIEKCGINYKLLEEIASHKNPLYLAVHDKNLGMEKLDYLERDGLFTILSRPAGIDYLRNHIYFINKELVIDEKVIDNAVEVQHFYMKMYKNVYLRKASLIAQRMFQKIVYYLIKDGELERRTLPSLTDSELIGKIASSLNPSVITLYDFLKKRELLKEAIVIRPEKFMPSKNQKKAVAKFGVDEKTMEKLTEAPSFREKNQENLLELERKIAKIAGLEEELILAVPVLNSWRFKPKDIKIYRGKEGIVSLKDRYPAHFKNMEEIARSYAAFRICTTEKHRKVLSSPKISRRIFQLVMETVTL